MVRLSAPKCELDLFCAKLLPKLGTGNRLLRNTLNLVGNIN
jgi:hypothetical protein